MDSLERGLVKMQAKERGGRMERLEKRALEAERSSFRWHEKALGFQNLLNDVISLQIECIRDGNAAPSGDCGCGTCETMRDLQKATERPV